MIIAYPYTTAISPSYHDHAVSNYTILALSQLCLHHIHTLHWHFDIEIISYPYTALSSSFYDYIHALHSHPHIMIIPCPTALYWHCHIMFIPHANTKLPQSHHDCITPTHCSHSHSVIIPRPLRDAVGRIRSVASRSATPAATARETVNACVRACVRACVHVCVCVCVRARANAPILPLGTLLKRHNHLPPYA